MYAPHGGRPRPENAADSYPGLPQTRTSPLLIEGELEQLGKVASSASSLPPGKRLAVRILATLALVGMVAGILSSAATMFGWL
ncbi:hypothetical protein [Longispora albida]|uniref:hypothetical protein n=1 Tax=Longispora albida TaxID=203523 RepID=UPI000363F90C|nr:hypothetical protein [Longispora albida]